MRYKKDGKRYLVSPYLLVWNDANYYLVAYEAESGMIKHYRVDKMSDLQVEEQKRQGKEEYQAFSPGVYTRKNFQMFGGKEVTVTMQCEADMAGVMIDRFGKEVSMRQLSSGKIQVRTEVIVSPPFFGWIAGLNGKVQITAPEEIAAEVKTYLLGLIQKWDEENIQNKELEQ
jgi:predicted DNA-binding transcriptional regulator YafY